MKHPFILPTSIETLNIDSIHKLFNFKLNATKRHFNNLKVLKDIEEIKKMQRITKFFEIGDLQFIEDEIVDLNIECINKGLKLTVSKHLDKVTELVCSLNNNGGEGNNVAITEIVRTTSDYISGITLPNYQTISKIASSYLKICDFLEKIEPLKLKLIEGVDSLKLDSETKSDNIKIIEETENQLINPLKEDISHFKEKINSVFKYVEEFNEEFISVKTERQRPLNPLTNPSDVLHEYILKSLETMNSKIEQEADKILNISSKIKRVDQGTFRVPRTVTMDDVRRFSSEDKENLPIFVGTSKVGTLLTYTTIKSLTDSIKTLQGLLLLMDSERIYKISVEFNKDVEVLERIREVFVKVDLHNSFFKSGMKNCRVILGRKNCSQNTSNDTHGNTSNDTHNNNSNDYIDCQEPEIKLENFYHPLVEDCIKNNLSWGYSSCNACLNNSNANNSPFITLSGPNTSGKSTILRTIAISSFLTQIGAPCPIEGGHLPLFSCIRIRIGSQDSEGESTYMREMREVKEIIDICELNSELKSLILIDELGRGTSIIDGISMSIAIKKFLLKKNVFTIFVTHFEELKEIKVDKNKLNLSLKDYKLIESSGDSFGIECAKSCGFPDDVISDIVKFKRH